MTVLNQDQIVREAIAAHQNGEVVQVKCEPETAPATAAQSSVSVEISSDNLDNTNEEKEPITEITDIDIPCYEASNRAKLGKEIEEIMLSGKQVPENLIIDLLQEKLRAIPLDKGWLLRGFNVSHSLIQQMINVAELQAIIHCNLSDSNVIHCNAHDQNPDTSIEKKLISFGDAWEDIKVLHYDIIVNHDRQAPVLA